ncbi:hypothetical protein COHA_007121 [Chlorella ohadii]|uniref:RRM domain-containing protein n=1 Tax=Chlorella ohadii TaxID=2649997 RepID=A0AAD5DMY5_9CHLO|nr:hypothetical protein COHA_007121 [Chlorella ohadii]
MDYEAGDYGHQNGSGAHGADAAGGQEEGSAVFISNLQWWTTDAELEQLCAAYGRVTSIRFIDDKACGKSRGMAIVEFAEADAASQCITGLNGRDINGRPCRVAHQQQRNQPGASSRAADYGSGRAAGSRGDYGGGRGGGRGGRGGRRDDLSSNDMMAAAGGMLGAGMLPGMMVPGMMPAGMMGMAMPGMDMMQGMMMMPGMQGMVPFGMPGMAGFKPPPPPGAPPVKKE